MITKEQVLKLAEEAIEGTDRFVVEVKVKPGNRILVFIDADSSVTIDNCVEVSRHIEHSFDRDVEDFELEVSSAGLDFPLSMMRQLSKYVGKEVEVISKDKTKVVGKLISFDEEKIEVEEILIKKSKKKKVQEGTLVFERSMVEVKPAIIF
jgi:Uncharacterized protein conserved in bacteria